MGVTKYKRWLYNRRIARYDVMEISAPWKPPLNSVMRSLLR